MATEPLRHAGEQVPDDGESLPYWTARRSYGYVPPYYPERGEGTAALVLRLVIAAVMVLAGSTLMIFSIGRLLLPALRFGNSERILQGFVLVLVGGAYIATPGTLLGMRAVRPLWKRWRTRLRRGGR